jgi:aminobenzoyl-glutamate utilization protein B
MTETKLEVKVIDKCYNMIPNRVLSQIAHEEFLAVGAPQIPPGYEKYIEGLGLYYQTEQIETVLEEYYMPLIMISRCMQKFSILKKEGEVAPGSTDAGDVSWKAPLAQINVACMPVGTPGHSWMAVSAFRSELGIQGMLTAASVLSRTGWRWLKP